MTTETMNPDKWREITSCPWCGSDEWSDVANRSDGIPVRRCSRCTLMFTGRLPDDLSVFYEDGYFDSACASELATEQVGYANYEAEFSPTSFYWLATLASSLAPEGVRLLDIGAANGAFLRMAEHCGFDVAGSEINSEAALDAQQWGLDVRPGPFDPTDWEDGSFDVITALEILEHVEDLGGMLSAIREKLKKDGLLLFYVPLLTNQLVADHGNDLAEFQTSLEHTLYFTPKALETIFNDSFGSGCLTLLAGENAADDEPGAFALGVVRQPGADTTSEARIFAALDGDREALDTLTSDEAVAVALTSSKLQRFEQAEYLLETTETVDEGRSGLTHVIALLHQGASLDAANQLRAVLAGMDILAIDPIAFALLDDIALQIGRATGIDESDTLSLLSNMHTQIVTQQSDISSRGRQVTELMSDVEGLAREQDQLHVRIAELEKSLAAEREITVAEQTRLKQSQAEAREHLKTSLRLRQQLQDVQRKLEDSSGRNAQLTAKLDATMAKLDATMAELDAIYTSRAWKALSSYREIRTVATSRLRSTFAPRRAQPPDAATSDAETTPGMVANTEQLLSGFRRDAESCLVTVVIPVYNKGWDLIDAIDSVLNQTLTDVEIIVWDDGSTDKDTLDAIAEARRRSGVEVYSGPNRGLSATRNRAIAVSRGQYICSLDPDDTFEPTYLEKAAALLMSEPEVAIVYPWVHTTGDKEEMWRTHDLDPALIGTVNHVAVCAMYRRDVYFATGGYNPSMKEGYEDWEFWIHAVELGFRGRVIPEPLFNYTYSDDPNISMLQRARKAHHGLLRNMRELHPLVCDEDSSFEPPPNHLAPSAVERRPLSPRNLPIGSGRPVVITVPWFTVGGADRVVESLARHWTTSGRTVVIVATQSPGPGMDDRSTEILKITPYFYNLPTILPEKDWLDFFLGILDDLGEATLLNVGSTWIYRTLPTLKESVPELRVIDQQFNDVGHFDSNRLAASWIDVTVAAYEQLATALLDDSRSPESVVSIFVGIEPSDNVRISTTAARRELGIPEDDAVIAFIGRLSVEKRPGWIVRLAEAAPASTTVLVVGDGPLSSVLSDATDQQIPLVWHRNIPNIQTGYAAADVVVLPSLVEGIPLTMLEALGAGVPVVATAVGGIPELGDLPGVNLVPSNDYTAFADAAFATAAGPAGSVTLPSRYSLDAMTAEYDRIIDPHRRRD